MKFLDLFSGIGGFRVGLEMAGHECVGHCEIDKFANKSYIAMHNPKESEWFGEDITKVRADELPRADIWCFGFPCQDISIAGKQSGFGGHRSSLFFTVTRLIRDLEEENRPSILFIENVKNLLSINRGGDFLKLLIELDEIGYDAEWQILNSKDFGVPQNRERVFVIGHLRGRSGRKVFPVCGTSQSANIRRIAHANNFRRYYQTYSTDGITEALDTCQGGGRQPCVKVLANTHPSGRGMNGNIYDISGLAPTLTTNKGEGNKIAIPVLTPDRVNKRQNGRRFKEDGEPMFTLTAQDRHGVSDGDRVRKLTPKECFRLQGFPDEYFERARKVNSDSQLYKQAGNGVTVDVIYEIARRL